MQQDKVTTDTVTQDWVEAFRPTEKHYTTTGYGNRLLISDTKPEFTPFGTKPIQPMDEDTFLIGTLAGAGIVITAILITYAITIL